ncbi:growth/differentiation factor 9-like [Platysternon megacephalum]|uniref:Growth/differentiation factor 9-like n=1 Tax=Platysternon megacephalum TaxID=55544 RepID=A0A4D9ET91_9SAUR|nr:growth/differentiation factor 9-like [Platysternon megacephalum]
MLFSCNDSEQNTVKDDMHFNLVQSKCNHDCMSTCELMEALLCEHTICHLRKAQRMSRQHSAKNSSRHQRLVYIELAPLLQPVEIRPMCIREVLFPVLAFSAETNCH